MGRVPQDPGQKGSLKWIQQIINHHPDILNKQINKLFNRDPNLPIEWLSPKQNDDYAEYRDTAFLDLLGIKLTKRKLEDFWPQRGPQWDGLGKVSETGTYFLLEAKANIPVMLWGQILNSELQYREYEEFPMLQVSIGKLKC